jgi:hypothetical protein
MTSAPLQLNDRVRIVKPSSRLHGRTGYVREVGKEEVKVADTFRAGWKWAGWFRREELEIEGAE